jgi:hypothetical protein
MCFQNNVHFFPLSLYSNFRGQAEIGALTGSTPRQSKMATVVLRLSFAHNLGQVLANGDRLRVLDPSSFLQMHAQCPLAKELRLYIAILHKGEFGRAVESFSGSGILRSRRLLNDSEGLPPKHLSLLIVSL